MHQCAAQPHGVGGRMALSICDALGSAKLGESHALKEQSPAGWT